MHTLTPTDITSRLSARYNCTRFLPLFTTMMRLFCAEAILNVKARSRMKAKSHDGVTLCQAPQMRHNARQEVWMQAQSGYNRARKKGASTVCLNGIKTFIPAFILLTYGYILI